MNYGDFLVAKSNHCKSACLKQALTWMNRTANTVGMEAAVRAFQLSNDKVEFALLRTSR